MRNAGNGIARLDVNALYFAVQAEMGRRDLRALSAVAQECGLNVGPLYRMYAGSAPDAHNVCALLRWLGEDHWWMAPPKTAQDS